MIFPFSTAKKNSNKLSTQNYFFDNNSQIKNPSPTPKNSLKISSKTQKFKNAKNGLQSVRFNLVDKLLDFYFKTSPRQFSEVVYNLP